MLYRLALACSVFLLFGSSSVVFAQTGTINGRVVDQGDAVLPGVTINLRNVNTGATRSTVTNEQGVFNVPALERGTYEITSELAGFAPQSRTVELIAGSTVTADFKLGLAGLSETLTVAGSIPLVETTQALVSATIRQTEVQQLPMVNRSLAAMMTLLPGAREVPASGSHGHAAGYVSFAGNTGRSYNMYVDGVDNKEDQDGGTLVQLSLDGIEEFRALGAGFQAEYGRGSTVVVLASKSGTNLFKGTGYLFGRNESLIATDYFSKPENGGLGEQPFERFQFGGSLGGPVKQDRMWFFTSAERIMQDFQLPRTDRQIAELRIMEGLGIGVVASASVPQPFRDLLFQGKVNFQMSQNHSGFVRYMSQYGYVDNNALNNTHALWSSNPFAQRNDQNLYSAAGGWTWIVNPSTVNEFRAQWAYYLHDDISGFSCMDLAACVPRRLNFPSVGSAQPNFAQPTWVNYETKFEIMNNFSKQIGNHSFKLGVDYARLPTFYANLMTQSPGNITFFDDPSVILNNTNGRYPQGFQTPGIVRSITQTSLAPVDAWSNQAYFFAGFVQDDWKVSPRLTLNMGLRYDINEMSNQCCWDRSRSYKILKDIGHPYGALPNTDTNNFAPRLGAAWDVKGDGSEVVRGSFGVFYATGIITSAYVRNFEQQDTVYLRSTLANSGIGSGPLANYVYGVSPLPAGPPFSATEFLRGGNTTGAWYTPDFADAYSINSSIGFSHLFSPTTVLSVDYLHVETKNGWRSLEINPLIDHDNNPATGRVRALAADLQRVYGDPALLGPTQVLCACNDGKYDGIDFHFERRLAQTALTVNYTLAWARGMGGSTDFTTQGGHVGPEVQNTLGGDIYADTEWGPTQMDERHRVTVAGVVPLPFGFDVAPSFTAASARPYTRFSAVNPAGTGSLYLRDANGNPLGPYNARGKALVSANARVTRHFDLAPAKRLSLFAEFYNILNRANFGNSFGGNAFAPATYNQPIGYLGGIGSTTTLPISFQVQFGGRFSF
ncbi:MAG: carboxypeptidase regulatory-like domain-containing protein [Vicinamibacterales bacterium]